jgi:hypothetical protein
VDPRSPIAVLKVVHLLDEIGDRQTAYPGVFGAPFAVRVVAQRAGAHAGPPAMRHDFGHLGMVLRKPVRRAEAVINLRSGELQFAAV